MYEHAC